MAKTETQSTGRAIALRGFNYAPSSSSTTGLPVPEIRVDAGAEIPSSVPDSVIAALVAEGAAKR